jgi:hypothetical protein
MDDVEFSKTIPDFREQMDYLQPWQLNDHIRLQLQADFGPHNIRILDNMGETVNVLQFTKGQTNVQNPNMNIYEIDISCQSAIGAEGVYRFQLESGQGPDVILQSNLLDIRSIHKYSLLFQYKNYQYHEGLIFETGFYPWLRVEGALPYKSPASKDTIFEDQPLNETVLFSQPYRLFELIIGDSYGVPDYLIDLVDRILSCSDVLIDDHQYTKSDGSSWSATGDDDYPMRGWRRDLRESLNSDSMTYLNGNILNRASGFIISIDSRGFGANPGGTTFNILDVE